MYVIHADLLLRQFRGYYRIHNLGCGEVDQLYVVVRIKENISRFEISVDDFLFSEVLEGLHYLSCEMLAQVETESPLSLQQFLERAIRHVLEKKVESKLVLEA